MENFKKIFITVFAALSSWLGILYVPMLVLVLCNIIDYGTGLCAARYRSEKISSYKSFRGIAKKVCQWLLVGVGAVLDWLLTYTVSYTGIVLSVNFVIASVAAVWLIANELISILENMADIGVKLPPFLMKIAVKIKSETEEKTDSCKNNNEEENK